jgi:predicted aldo/keto reductase-like oxidoreductase
VLALSRLDRESWPQAKKKGLLTRAERAISAGKVGSLGFAFHDHFQILRQVLQEYGDWSFSQFQFSFMDAGHDPGASGLAYAADQGIAVVVKEALKGGRLTKAPPESVRKIWGAAPEQRSLADWGLRYVWNHPAVSTAVCGVSSMDQLVDDLALAEEAEAGALMVRDELTINRARDAYNELKTIDCASCRPCMPCPQGLDVPRIFEIYNDAITYGDVETARSIYRDEGHRADECVECGVCERKCCRREPLPIMALLKTAADLLGGGE